MKKTYLVSCYFKHNYGSMLQAYALQEYLKNNYIENETIDISILSDFSKGKRNYYKTQILNPSFYKAKLGMIKMMFKKKLNKKIKCNFKLRDDKFQRFQDNYLNLTEAFNTYNDLNIFFKKNASNVIVGSDQLWLPVNVVADYYTLNYVPDSVNKVSYSTSFGVSELPNNLVNKYKSFLNRLDYISVREESGKKLVNSLVDKECTVVCDPTILLTKDEWFKLCNDNPIFKGNYIFCYFLGTAVEHRKFAEKLKKFTGYKIVSINHSDEFSKYSDVFADEIPYDVGPSEWINLIANAKYICTDSFHGTVFSLLFNKTFFSFRRFTNKSKFSTNSRLDTLLKKAGLNDRIFTGFESEAEIKELINKSINYETVNSNLDVYRKQSQKWLLNSLDPNFDGGLKGIQIYNKKMCCGCSACESVCPKEAITMAEDEEGFKYPVINQDKCVNCHLCERTCPILNRNVELETKQKAFLIRNKDEQILLQSTSGGAFSAFAEVIIDEGGVVFGGSFDDNYEVHHIIVENKEDIYKFRNSKYVQSDLEDNFKKCRSYLNENRLVLFSGTPCQIEGLVSFLGKKPDNLFLADVVCHSVPSRKVWRKYKEYRISQNEHLKPIAFRDKSKYGYEYSQMRFDDEKKHYTGVESDPYLRLFFNDISIRPSCYQCRFKKRYRVSDLTIWDCFDIHKLDKEFDDNKGVTRCLVHSKKGIELIEKSKKYALVKEIDINKAIKGVREMTYSVKENRKRKAFFEDLNKLDCVELFEKWVPNSLPIKVKYIIRNGLELAGIYRPVKRFVKKMLGR